MRSEKSLIELVKMRASQINGCAYCLDMHSKNARRVGENRAAALSPQRLARFRAGRT
jgi:AhpD family alkylhydroperoxidase